MIRSELFRQPHSKCRDMLRVGVLVEHGGGSDKWSPNYSNIDNRNIIRATWEY